MRTLFALVIVVIGWSTTVDGQTAPAQAAQGQQAAVAAPPPAAAPDLGVSLERIRRDLGRPAVLRSVSGMDTPMFRVEVTGVLPRFSDFVGGNEALRAYAPFGGLTHNEFLTMVTPPQMRPYGAFTNGDLLQVLATSLLSNLAMQGAAGGGIALVNAIKSGLKNRERSAARAEVEAVLAELERRRLEAEAKKAKEAPDAQGTAPPGDQVPKPKPPDPPGH